MNRSQFFTLLIVSTPTDIAMVFSDWYLSVGSRSNTFWR